MSVNVIAKNYACLSPDERFRLILAASGRGDEAERNRLVSSAGQISLSMSDCAPYAHAFDELALVTFIDLMEHAAIYFNAHHHYSDGRDFSDDHDSKTDEQDDAEEHKGDAQDAPGESVSTDSRGDDADELAIRERLLDEFLAAGFVLQTKADGWKLFCERLNVPPFGLWESLPGFDRLRLALAVADKAAFLPEGILLWLNRKRLPGTPERTNLPFTVEAVADATEKSFREGVEWWGGPEER
jgi:hypothetical protein